MGVIDGAALSPGTQRGKRGGGRLKSYESRSRMQEAGLGRAGSARMERAWLSAQVALTLSGRPVFGARRSGCGAGGRGGGSGQAGSSASGVCRAPSPVVDVRACLPAFEEPGGCLSLCVSPVAPSSPWLVGSPGSRGGPLLPPSESGGESGRPAGPRRPRPRNRCACGGGAARRGVGPSGGRRRGNSAGPGVSRVCVCVG